MCLLGWGAGTDCSVVEGTGAEGGNAGPDVRKGPRDGGATDDRGPRDGGATDDRGSRDGGATDDRGPRDDGATDDRGVWLRAVVSGIGGSETGVALSFDLVGALKGLEVGGAVSSCS